MYKPNNTLLKNNIKELFNENRIYKCKQDIHCQKGVFEKNSLVKIKNILVTRDNSDITEEYISLYDIDTNIQNDIPTIEINEQTNYDIPIGINIRNFNNLFEEETTIQKTEEMATKKLKKQDIILKIINIIKNIMIVISIIAFCTDITCILYEILFKHNTILNKEYSIMILVLCTIMLCIITQIAISIKTKNNKNSYYESIKNAYEQYKKIIQKKAVK